MEEPATETVQIVSASPQSSPQPLEIAPLSCLSAVEALATQPFPSPPPPAVRPSAPPIFGLGIYGTLEAEIRTIVDDRAAAQARAAALAASLESAVKEHTAREHDLALQVAEREADARTWQGRAADAAARAAAAEAAAAAAAELGERRARRLEQEVAAQLVELRNQSAARVAAEAQKRAAEAAAAAAERAVERLRAGAHADALEEGAATFSALANRVEDRMADLMKRQRSLMAWKSTVASTLERANSMIEMMKADVETKTEECLTKDKLISELRSSAPAIASPATSTAPAPATATGVQTTPTLPPHPPLADFGSVVQQVADVREQYENMFKSASEAAAARAAAAAAAAAAADHEASLRAALALAEARRRTIENLENRLSEAEAAAAAAAGAAAGAAGAGAGAVLALALGERGVQTVCEQTGVRWHDQASDTPVIRQTVIRDEVPSPSPISTPVCAPSALPSAPSSASPAPASTPAPAAPAVERPVMPPSLSPSPAATPMTYSNLPPISRAQPGSARPLAPKKRGTLLFAPTTF